jgi:hypothetical protein
MKRLDLIRHLERHGCEFLREGGSHTIYVNRPRKKRLQFLDIEKFWNSLPAKSKDLEVPLP